MASSHLGTDWRDQWDRIVRLHKKATAVRDALPPDGPEKTQALDDIFSFFTNCYHMRYWAINGGHPRAAEVDNFISGSAALRLCRDICTGLKHYRAQASRALESAEWSTATRSPAVVTMASGKSRLVGGHRTGWVFVTETGDRDMFTLADECLEAWRSFLSP
jgi:hypothetical protein